VVRHHLEAAHHSDRDIFSVFSSQDSNVRPSGAEHVLDERMIVSVLLEIVKERFVVLVEDEDDALLQEVHSRGVAAGKLRLGVARLFVDRLHSESTDSSIYHLLWVSENGALPLCVVAEVFYPFRWTLGDEDPVV